MSAQKSNNTLPATTVKRHVATIADAVIAATGAKMSAVYSVAKEMHAAALADGADATTLDIRDDVRVIIRRANEDALKRNPLADIIGKSTLNHYVNAAHAVLVSGKGGDADAPAAAATVADALAKSGKTGLTAKTLPTVVDAMRKGKGAATGVATGVAKVKRAKTAADKSAAASRDPQNAAPKPKPGEPIDPATDPATSEPRTLNVKPEGDAVAEDLNRAHARLKNARLAPEQAAKIRAILAAMAETVGHGTLTKPDAQNTKNTPARTVKPRAAVK